MQTGECKCMRTAACIRFKAAAALHCLPLPQIDKNVEREIINHRMLSGHPNIVRFREVFLTSTHLGM